MFVLLCLCFPLSHSTVSLHLKKQSWTKLTGLEKLTKDLVHHKFHQICSESLLEAVFTGKETIKQILLHTTVAWPG